MKCSNPKTKLKKLSDEDRLNLMIETARKSGISLDALVPLLDGVGDVDLARVAGNAVESWAKRTQIWHDTEADAERLLELACGTASALLVLDEQLKLDPMADALMALHSQMHELLVRIHKALYLNRDIEQGASFPA